MNVDLAEVVRAYLDCRRLKRNTAAALAFEARLEPNLVALHRDLRADRYRIGRSICFVVTRPKPREVWAADFRDRIVHHLLYNRIAPAIHASFIADSFACIPGRGTMRAAERLETHARRVTQNWTRPAHYLKCDIRNFFVGIDKSVLDAQLAARIADPEWLALARQILHHDPRADVEMRTPDHLQRLVPPCKRLTEQPAHRGLPIGNLSSQFFANVFLDALDQFAKHDLHARHYVRYVDDFILLHPSAAWLTEAHDAIAAFLPAALGVQLNPAKTIRQPIARGIDFVGQVIRPHRRNVRRRTVKAALQRIEHLPRGDLLETVNSTFGLLRQASHGRRDRAALAKAAMARGMAINRELTKGYRP